MENEHLSSEELTDGGWELVQSLQPSLSNGESDENLVDSFMDGSTSDATSNSNSNVSSLMDSENGFPVAPYLPLWNQTDTNAEIEDKDTVYKEFKYFLEKEFERLKCRILTAVSGNINNYGTQFLQLLGKLPFVNILFLLAVFVFFNVNGRRGKAELSKKNLKIREKDQRITEMLLEITRLKGILIQQRTVKVTRV